MKALFLTADGVEDSELFYPLYRMKEEGIETVVATPGGQDVSGKHGYSFPAAISLDQASADDCDILILPGGKGPETVRLNANAVKVTRQCMEQGKCVAAVCHGAQVLVSADVLSGRNVTCWAAIRDDVQAAGAQYSDEEVVVDGQLITSRCPDDLPAFCKQILTAVGVAH
jgi:protease I